MAENLGEESGRGTGVTTTLVKELAEIRRMGPKNRAEAVLLSEAKKKMGRFCERAGARLDRETVRRVQRTWLDSAGEVVPPRSESAVSVKTTYTGTCVWS